ncbi:hypothetical protein N7541_005561 [Penicillium brevicompactum]|uniref:HECT-type E3 ubiquitin transferase n=1 Tax=Penicillium brevicompactum TaxID=5074 RepID=A0A9W9R6B8_PENBR|nr:hypothetical protein N7541_005561 [Penicillium brevicompactum]
MRRARFFQMEEAGELTTSVPKPEHGNQLTNDASSAQKDLSKSTGPELASPQTTGTNQQELDRIQCQQIDHMPGLEPKDPKSFTQNLFDTLSLRMVEWLPLRRGTVSSEPKLEPQPPKATAQSPPAAGKASHRDKPSSRPKKEAQRSKSPKNPGSQPRTPSSRTSGSQPPAVELKLQNQHVKRVSIPDVENWHQSPRSSLDEKKRPEFNKKVPVATDEFHPMSPPALKHRPQKHRGRIDEVESVPLKERRKTQRRVSWDSDKLLNEVSPVKNPAGTDVITPLPPPHYSPRPPSEHNTEHSPVEELPDTIPLAQTITHFTPEIINALSQVIIETEEDADSWREEVDHIQSTGSFEQPEWRFATLRQREVFPYIAQSTFFVLSSPRQLLLSFGTDPENIHGVNSNGLDVLHLRVSLQRLIQICPWDIALHSLWGSLDRLFIPPSEFTSSGRPSRRSSRSSTMTGPTASVVPRRISGSNNEEYLSDQEAAYISTIALFTLVSSMPEMDMATWRAVVQMRAKGSVASFSDMRKLPSHNSKQAVEVTDRLEHELGLRLITRLVRAITARLAYFEISKARRAYEVDQPKQRRVSVLDRVVDHLSDYHNSHAAGSNESINPASLLVEWLRTLFLREWDGNPEMARSGPAGGAIQILSSLYKARNRLGLSPEEFHTPLLTERLDPLDMPVAWVGRIANNRTMYLLSYPFLFPPSSLVIYFRALNYSAMTKSYEAAMTTTRHVTQTAFGAIQIADDSRLLTRMKTSMSTYLVIAVRRDNILSDALSQLWRREKRELMRPLKVQMGMDEGEEGLDHGGVQQEFFRVLMGQAFDPCYGMFTIDTRHRVSWFQPCSLEPLYKFELIGLLMSIAIFNGLTLPLNLPIAFYRKVLGLKVKTLEHIRDGWPELSSGLDTLLTWKDGDVGDIFTRTYEFSFEAFGKIETVDMQKVGRDSPWPSSSKPDPIAGSSAWIDIPNYGNNTATTPPSPMTTGSIDAGTSSDSVQATKSVTGVFSSQPLTPLAEEEAALVTNDTRHQFVKDYIFWLTDKSIRPQFEAFQRGFSTCLDRSALSIFSPEALKMVVEGIQSIDVDELENHVRYDGGFGPNHRVIRDFWSVVREYPNEKKAQLLEFVTASDRVPVNGISSIMFVIQKNGVGDLRLPTSLTCFGRLLLPEYSSREALAEKLDKALDNAQGFGVA